MEILGKHSKKESKFDFFWLNCPTSLFQFFPEFIQQHQKDTEMDISSPPDEDIEKHWMLLG